MASYTLDTNTVIYYANGDIHATRSLDAIFANQPLLYMSSVSEIELFGFPKLTQEEENRIDFFLHAIVILPLNSQIARLAASLRKQHSVKTLDSAVAATALVTGSELLTRNIRDFKNIPNLSLRSV